MFPFLPSSLPLPFFPSFFSCFSQMKKADVLLIYQEANFIKNQIHCSSVRGPLGHLFIHLNWFFGSPGLGNGRWSERERGRLSPIEGI